MANLGGRREEQSTYAQRRRTAKADKKAAVIAYVARNSDGKPRSRVVLDALQAIGVKDKKTYMVWRREDPHFALKVDMARMRGADGTLPGMDFITHRRTYFGRDTPAHHLQMVTAIETAPADSITLILAPPEAAKSSLIVDYCCFKLGEDPNFRIAIVSESQTLARKMVGQIARRMMDESQFADYIHAYGPFRSEDRADNKPWNADALYLVRSTHDEKDPSLEARGASGQIYGARYDLLILDDIQSTSNIGETDRLVRDFRQTMLSRVSAERGKTIIVGSRVERGDFYERLLDEEEGELVDQLVQIRALDGEGNSYWPEWWPNDRLERRRKKVGMEAWARAYMQEPAMVGTPTFTPEMLKACEDPGLSMGSLLPVGQKVVCAVDPALEGWTAMVALAYDANHAWVLDVDSWLGLGRSEEILARAEEWSMRYRPQSWVVEIGAYQGALARDQRFLDMGRRFGFEVLPHTTAKSKADPSLGVGSMASSWSLKEITVPVGSAVSRQKADAFHRELLAWRPGVPGKLLVMDRVMAAWFAWRHWMNQRPFFTPKVRIERRPTWTGQRPELRMPA